ncbi:SRPBCC family protein [Arthrobacter sedimenti]|uniref:SRPBCC family protein n=1 Tax=Arthrobacter sedimenti TaxID=2694931 RepID=UPI000B35E38C|nr:SRPBCC family protein [Arthrobacter sedimenti]OUM41144.1 polyketide cyclase [Arthrobacter agilis]
MKNPTTITAEPGQPFVAIVRDFDAPRDVVFRAFTEPDLVRQWLGPRRMIMEILEFDAVTGGAYSYVHRDGEGNAYGFRGIFHTVVAPERIIQTFEFDGAPHHVSLDSMTFEDLGDGRTRCSGRSAFLTVEARDAMIGSGMEKGVNEGHERLDDVLSSLSLAG